MLCWLLYMYSLPVYMYSLPECKCCFNIGTPNKEFFPDGSKVLKHIHPASNANFTVDKNVCFHATDHSYAEHVHSTIVYVKYNYTCSCTLVDYTSISKISKCGIISDSHSSTTRLIRTTCSIDKQLLHVVVINCYSS